MREILFQISAAALLTAVVKALIPSDGYKKQFGILLSCFFISVVIRAVAGLEDFEAVTGIFDSGAVVNDYTVQAARQTADETAALLKERIGARLAENDIFPEKIYIDVNILNGDNISISEIRLVFRNTPEEEMQRAVILTEYLTGGEVPVTAKEQ